MTLTSIVAGSPSSVQSSGSPTRPSSWANRRRNAPGGTVDIPKPVVDALKLRKKRQAAERLKAGPAWSDLGLVFSTEIGTLVDPSNYRRQLSKVTEAAGLGHWSPNELRHSAVSLLSAAGVPIEHIGDVVGHDGTRMTAGVYRHAVAPSVDVAVGPMEALFGS